MVDTQIILVGFLIIVIAAIANIAYTYRTRKQIALLLSSTKKQTLESYLESLSAQSINTSKQLEHLTDIYEEVRLISEKSLQKVSLVRFNPFKDTGGDQSFVLCVLDHNNSGFLLTAIHNREGTRVYTKQIINGSAGLSLSVEEKQALVKAIK